LFKISIVTKHSDLGVEYLLKHRKYQKLQMDEQKNAYYKVSISFSKLSYIPWLLFQTADSEFLIK